MHGCGFCAETEGRAAQGGACGLRVPELFCRREPPPAPVFLSGGGEAPGH